MAIVYGAGVDFVSHSQLLAVSATKWMTNGHGSNLQSQENWSNWWFDFSSGLHGSPRPSSLSSLSNYFFQYPKAIILLVAGWCIYYFIGDQIVMLIVYLSAAIIIGLLCLYQRRYVSNAPNQRWPDMDIQFVTYFGHACPLISAPNLNAFSCIFFSNHFFSFYDWQKQMNLFWSHSW